MTIEKEARIKWCPHAVASHTDPRAKINGVWAHKCIGSECSQWRRDTTQPAKVENLMGQLVDRDLDGTGRWHYHGYCGLAGKE